MPKHEIDYSNTIIYKITCKDTNISDLYVGHTTNFVQRKHSHKQSSINEKNYNYKCKLYEVIRNNGGWENWKMEIINFFNCKNQYEARKKEQEYFLSLKATLNSVEPYAIPKPKETIVKNKIIKEDFHCKECNKYFNNNDLLETHNKTNNHLTRKSIVIAKNCEKLLYKFECILCQYNTSRKSSYDKHLFTARHINRTKLNNAEKPNVNPEKLMCKNCNKVYKVRNSLWYHEQKCKKIENVLLNQINQNSSIHDASNNVILLLINENKELINDNKDFKNIIMELVKNNNQLQKHIVDVCGSVINK
jgi:hypothetical protein